MHLSNKQTGFNIVYMKRFLYGVTSKSTVTTEDKITSYEIWLYVSHASYTLNRQTAQKPPFC